MKKLFLTMLIAMVSVCAFAQKGQKAIGANLSYTPSLEDGIKINNFGIAAKFQYNLTDALRSELAVGYDFKDKEIGFFTAAANFHYLFNVGEKLKVYPIVGVGYAHMDYGLWEDLNDMFDDYDDYYYYYDDGDDDAGMPSKNKLLVNAGAGAEYELTENISLSAEVKYQYIKDACRLPISIGISYKF